MQAANLRHDIEELYFDYAECLDEMEFERWPEFFTDDCLYKIISRENHDRNLPLATMMCEGRGGLKDRVVGIRETTVYHQRAMRHLLSNLRIKEAATDSAQVQVNYAVIETPTNEFSRVFSCGKYVDTLTKVDGSWKFKEKLVIFDSVMVPASIVYPI